MHVHAERRLRAAKRAGLVVLDRLVGVLQHARRRDAETFVQRVLAPPSCACRARRDRRATPAARSASRRRPGRRSAPGRRRSRSGHRRRARRSRRRCRRSTAARGRSGACAPAADTIAWRSVLRRDLRAAVAVDRQRIARARASAAPRQIRSPSWSSCGGPCRPVSPAPSRGSCRGTGLDHLGARAGEAHQRHRAMAVLQRHLDADAERIAVLRAVAIAAQPARAALSKAATNSGEASRWKRSATSSSIRRRGSTFGSNWSSLEASP